ncbi:MAG TPA: hypothetical protein PKL83_01915 [bacterium]|nr:hypothetical protein [bacterium]
MPAKLRTESSEHLCVCQIMCTSPKTAKHYAKMFVREGLAVTGYVSHGGTVFFSDSGTMHGERVYMLMLTAAGGSIPEIRKRLQDAEMLTAGPMCYWDVQQQPLNR